MAGESWTGENVDLLLRGRKPMTDKGLQVKTIEVARSMRSELVSRLQFRVFTEPRAHLFQMTDREPLLMEMLVSTAMDLKERM